MTQLGLGLGVLACRTAVAQPPDDAAYVGIETSRLTGRSTASFFSPTGARRASLPLDFRAHGLAQSETTLIVFPRRPGNRFAVVDVASLAVRSVVTAPQDRHFYGHGAFTRDGQHLLVPENDLNTLSGGIGIYRVAPNMRRVGAIGLPGSGPHEIVRSPDRDLFFIAMGGLQTHPDYGRTPLNLDAFKSEVLMLDFARTEIDSFGVWHEAAGISLRHMALDGAGALVVGGQVARGDGVARAVLWRVSNGVPHMVDLGAALGGYVSSVAAFGGRVQVTSKETGAVITLSGDEVLSRTALEGASATALGREVEAASGFQVLRIGAHEVEADATFEFDNHGMMLRRI
ncbi:MAG: DUF1513 domain-containing protein [Pseudomonadota bacterium]